MNETQNPAARLLTIADLEMVRACEEQVAKFRELFGNEVLVTVELAVQHAADFDWDWAARKLLSAPARAAYNAAVAPEWDAYEASEAAADAAYDAATAAAWAAYEAARAPAWATAFIQDTKK